MTSTRLQISDCRDVIRFAHSVTTTGFAAVAIPGQQVCYRQMIGVERAARFRIASSSESSSTTGIQLHSIEKDRFTNTA